MKPGIPKGPLNQHKAMAMGRMPDLEIDPRKNTIKVMPTKGMKKGGRAKGK